MAVGSVGLLDVELMTIISVSASGDGVFKCSLDFSESEGDPADDVSVCGHGDESKSDIA